MSLKKQSRWTRRLFAALPGWGVAGALGASALSAYGLANAVRGQETTPESGIARTYIKTPLIHLPIEIDGGNRSQFKGLVLYAKEGANGAWSARDQAPPMQTSFTFRAPRDGEYWFRIVAIDNQGKAHPDNLAKDAQDAVIVIVDSVPPTLDVTYRGAVPEGQIIHCETRDANPDILKMRFSYQTRDELWRDLESLPNQPNLFCVPAQAAITNMIRVQAVDLAGNITPRTYNLSELAQAAPPSNLARPNPAPAQAIPVPLPQVAAQPPQMPAVQPAPSTTPIFVGSELVAPQASPFSVEPNASAEQNALTHPINPSPRVNKLPSAPQIVNGGPRMDMPPQAKPAETTVATEIETTAGTLAQQQIPTNFQIVGSTQVFLNYAVDNTGASGIGTMKVYATRDQGQSWQMVAEENQRKNPVEVTLPGEGVYGLKLIASNGRGFGAQPPLAGDPSDWWIEVDTTKPEATIADIRPGVGQDTGSLYITWKAEDKNLPVDSVELWHASRREGPWAPIAKGLKSTGRHRWLFPLDAGAHAYIRVVARDKAGNVGLSETTQPQPLDDQSRPRVRLINVTASPVMNVSSNTTGRVQQVETTNTPIDGPPPRLQPVPHSTSNMGVDVR